MATEGQKDYMNMSQGVEGQKAGNLQQIGMNDESNRISQLGTLSGQENQQNETNIANQMSNNQSANQFNLGQWQTQMGTYAGAQQGAADLLAGQKSGKK